MPRRSIQHQHIDVPVRPITIGGVIFQRLIRYVSHTPYQDPDTGEMSLSLVVRVQHYLTLPDGTQGPEAFALVPHREETFRTNNNELLDADTGELVLTRKQQTTKAWAEQQAADPRQLLGRGDAYEQQLYSGPVDLVPQLRAAMAAADAAPFWRFGGGPPVLEPTVPSGVPAEKQAAVMAANSAALLETEQQYFGQSFVGELSAEDGLVRYDCQPFTEADGREVYKWFRTAIL